MAKPETMAGGAVLGLLTVLMIILCGAIMGQTLKNPTPSPTSDRPPVIVPQP